MALSFLYKEQKFLGIFPYPLFLIDVFRGILCGYAILLSLVRAYDYRIDSVRQYGYLIHEFDPWFNFRAAQYMSDHGWHAFFHWFDRMSWYPIGRPVGTTIYPGMQITAVAIHRALAALGRPMSLNDICVLIPAWFGVLATLLLGAIAHELSNSLAVATMAMLTFSIIPAHTMRSMAGEFDNECIAMAAMLLTFYLWIRALRTPRAWPVGLLAGLAYGYMAAAWGGFIFVLNMIAMHASVCAVVDWVQNRYNVALLKAYSLFFVVGTAIATRVPPVGMSPFKSLEQLAALLVFVGLWTLQVSEYLRRRAGVEVWSMACLRIRSRVIFVAVGLLALLAALLTPSGYFGPFSVRVRALFMRHTRTGNPLVDSVAEHQPLSRKGYYVYLHLCGSGWLFGAVLLLYLTLHNYTPARGFLLLYSCTAYYFSTRMSRLVLFSGPIACVLSALFAGMTFDGTLKAFFWEPAAKPTHNGSPTRADKASEAASKHNHNNTHNNNNHNTHDHNSNNNNSHNSKSKSKKGGKAKDNGASKEKGVTAAEGHKHGGRGHAKVKKTNHNPLVQLRDAIRSYLETRHWVKLFMLLPLAVMLAYLILTSDFVVHAQQFARAATSPMIVFKARVRDEHYRQRDVLVDDYYQSYLWLKNHTPSDARVLAWWDYGYQITGIGNRTSLADGNTWNHEHIGTLGKLLTSPVKEAHSLIRHLADYVLIWAGQPASDLMKSAHMARIGNSVYHDICPDDPLCDNFGFHGNDIARPTPMMRRSLLYHMHGVGVLPGVSLDPHLFREVYTTKYGLVRIFKVLNVSKESKAWIADPANQVCSANDKWICPGQYPPAPEIQAMIAKRLAFEHPRNEAEAKWKERYNRLYMERMQRRMG